jgi:ribosomal protein S18 acetylase RimI-like enzyme
MISYREMQPSDFQAVFDMWAATPGVDLTRADNKIDFARFLERNPGSSFVAFHAEELVGAILCGHDARRGFLHHLTVHPDYRRQGIGTELVERCMTVLKAENIEKCHLFIRRDNKSGLEFWKQTGWLERTTLTMASRMIDHSEGPDDPNSS